MTGERVILSILVLLSAMAALAADIHYFNASPSIMAVVALLSFAALRWIWRRRG